MVQVPGLDFMNSEHLPVVGHIQSDSNARWCQGNFF